METYLALLLLIMPGYVAKTINGHLCDNINTNDKFRLTMEALMYDAAIIPIVYLLLHFWTADIDNINIFFANMKNIMVYAGCAGIVSVVFGILWKWILVWYQQGINSLRGAEKGEKPEANKITIGKSLFDISFNDGQAHLVEVYKDGNVIGRGYLSGMYYDNHEITLAVGKEEEGLTSMDESEKHYKFIYMDWKNGLVVKELKTGDESKT